MPESRRNNDWVATPAPWSDFVGLATAPVNPF
jgi:hypothetical protein